MNQEIPREIQKLFDVVSRRLGREHPEEISADLPLYSNTLEQDQTEEIRSGLQAKLRFAVNGFAPVVTLGRAQDENESGSLIVNFEKL
jgi:hypothetical protein